MTTVSIALAMYNSSRFLDQQLQTLASQERLPDELVVNASTDGTVAKIEAFAATAPFPVRLHRNAERLGYELSDQASFGVRRERLASRFLSRAARGLSPVGGASTINPAPIERLSLDGRAK